MLPATFGRTGQVGKFRFVVAELLPITRRRSDEVEGWEWTIK